MWFVFSIFSKFTLPPLIVACNAPWSRLQFSVWEIFVRHNDQKSVHRWDLLIQVLGVETNQQIKKSGSLP